MLNYSNARLFVIVCLALAWTIPNARANKTCLDDTWTQKSDEQFAIDCADMAFEGSLKDRQKLAWMLLTRASQLVSYPQNGGMSGTNKVPLWMTWATNYHTFNTLKAFDFDAAQWRGVMRSSGAKKDAAAGRSMIDETPNAANEIVSRNQISYDYLIQNRLTTLTDVDDFFKTNKYVDMPIGSVELKSSWLQVTKNSPAPEGALTFKFDTGEFWWRGIHIMAKMRRLDDPAKAFTTPDYTWFWTSFEFNGNDGLDHVRREFMTELEPLSVNTINTILAREMGLDKFGLEAYAPNGTQISFTVNPKSEEPSILGHSNMEDFAGSYNIAQPRY